MWKAMTQTSIKIVLNENVHGYFANKEVLSLIHNEGFLHQPRSVPVQGDLSYITGSEMSLCLTFVDG